MEVLREGERRTGGGVLCLILLDCWHISDGVGGSISDDVGLSWEALDGDFNKTSLQYSTPFITEIN